MTAQEAIENLNGCITSFEVGPGRIPNGNVSCDLTVEILDMAKEALEKQVPKKCDLDKDRWKHCPVCGTKYSSYWKKILQYCRVCGQHIDWED